MQYNTDNIQNMFIINVSYSTYTKHKMKLRSYLYYQKINQSSLLQIGSIPMINKCFRYIPEKESKGNILSSNKSLHVILTKQSKKKRDRTESKYFLHGEHKVFRKKTTHVCSDCAETDMVKNEMWVCNHKTNCSCFSQHMHSKHDL